MHVYGKKSKPSDGLTFGKMEGSLANGRYSNIFLNGQQIGYIEAKPPPLDFYYLRHVSKMNKISAYTVDLYDYGEAGTYETLKEARDAVRKAVDSPKSLAI